MPVGVGNRVCGDAGVTDGAPLGHLSPGKGPVQAADSVAYVYSAGNVAEPDCENGLPAPSVPKLGQMVGKLNRLLFNSTGGAHFVTFFSFSTRSPGQAQSGQAHGGV